MALAARRAARAAMHAADLLAAKRRLAAGAMVVLAPRLAPRRPGEAGTGVALRQHFLGHGVNGQIRRGSPPPPRVRTQGGEIQPRRARVPAAVVSKGESREHNEIITTLDATVKVAVS